MALDVKTKYYNKRKKGKDRIFYNTVDELFIAEGRYEYIGKLVIPSWLGIQDIEFDNGK